MRPSHALSVCLLATSVVSVVACATTPPPTVKPRAEPKVVVDTKPSVKPPAKLDDRPVEPVVVIGPSDPTSGRNRGFGPYDSLENICGSAHERCVMGEPVALEGSPTIKRIASFVEVPSDGSASLAFETKEGWFISAIPDGRPFGGGLSHHTPAGTRFFLEKAKTDGEGVLLVRNFSRSTFFPGQGSSGSSSFERAERMKCTVASGRVACGEGKVVFERSCHNGSCKQTGSHPGAG